ncbi:MAG: DUF3793 family protein [Candidatus Weimeria sp.]
MSEEMIVGLSAPTLAGIKTGSLFRVTFKDRKKLIREMAGLNRSVRRAGIIAVPLYIGEDAAVVYLYRPALLQRDIEKASAFLISLGYRLTGTAGMVAQLAERFSGGAFPHEVGIFLGYPLEDVKGFIHDPRAGYKLTGTWKVYGDARSAEDQFRRYRICTSIYTKALKEGAHIADLAVVI